MREDFPVELIADAAAAGEDGDTDSAFYAWLASDAGPDDWHRYAMEGNWDMHDPILYEWIVSQPDCDRATALLYFWKASPQFELEVESEPHAYEREELPLIALIRERWQAGAYSRSELAFSPDDDLWPGAFGELDRFGDRGLALLPRSMRVSLPGRRLDEGDAIEGIPKRFWPSDLWPDDA